MTNNINLSVELGKKKIKFSSCIYNASGPKCTNYNELDNILNSKSCAVLSKMRFALTSSFNPINIQADKRSFNIGVISSELFKKFNRVLFCPSLIIAADKIIWEIWLKFPSILFVSAIVIALPTEPCAMKDIIKLSRIKMVL